MYKEFSNKVVLVTGGTSGIGKSTAIAFAKWGAKVVITGRNIENGKLIESEAKDQGFSIQFIQNDVSKPYDVKKMIEYVVGKYKRLDIAFNNAGIDGDMGKTADCTIDNWKQVMDINLHGVFYSMKYQIKQMLKNNGGIIINNISVSGHKGYPGGIAYVSSKHGLVGLTKAAAMEYAKENIRVNGISPGLIRTQMTDKDREKKENYDEWVKQVEPIGRIGEATEVAEAVLWLSSSKSSFITGHIMAVDGGILAL